MRFLGPRTDFAFTKIFGNDQAHDVLIHFLNSLLYLKGEHNEIQYHFIELPKFKKQETDLDDTADRWIYFIKEAGNLENIPKSLEIGPYKHAFEIANIAGMSKEELDSFEAASIILQDEKGAVEAALDKGRSEGRSEGKIEGKIEGEKALLIRQIERKWSGLKPDVMERLNKINSLEELEALGEKVIISNCVEDLFPDE